MGVGTLSAGFLDTLGSSDSELATGPRPDSAGQSLDGLAQVTECRVGLGYGGSYKWHLDTVGPTCLAPSKIANGSAVRRTGFTVAGWDARGAGMIVAFTVSMSVRA